MKYGLWLNEWLEYYVRPVYKSRTYQKYRHIARTQLIPNFGEMEMTE
ncbi:MAG: site-specific integrase, partial [Christensenellaceae bacterium]